MSEYCKQINLSGKFIKEKWNESDYKYYTSDEDSDSISVSADSITDDKWYSIEFLWQGRINISEVLFITDEETYKKWS